MASSRMFWRRYDIDELLNAVNNGGVSMETLSRINLRGRFTPSECRMKLKELAEKPFTKEEDDDVMRYKDLIHGNPESASKCFKRPARVLQDRHRYLEGSRSKKLFDVVSVDKKKESFQANYQEDLVLVQEALGVEKQLLLEVKCQICLDHIVEGLSGYTDVVNLSKHSGHFRETEFITNNHTERIFYYAMFTKNVLVYVDLDGMKKYAAEILKFMNRYTKVPVLGCTSDVTKMDVRLRDLFSSRLEVCIPLGPTRSLILKQVFKSNKVDRNVDLVYWKDITYGYCLHALEKLGKDAALHRLTEDEEVKNVHLFRAFNSLEELRKR